MPKGDKFTVGDLVFAKVKGYPPWPARIIGMSSKDRYKIYFYGTYETSSLKNEDIWIYNKENKEKFAPKNMKRKGYPEGMNELENNPEIAGVEDDVPLSEIKTPGTPSADNTTSNRAKKLAKDTPKASPASRGTPKAVSKDTPVRGHKRKMEPAVTETPKSQKKGVADDVKTSRTSKVSDEQSEEDKSSNTSRSGRLIKLKKFENEASTPPPPSTNTSATTARRVKSSSTAEGKENNSPMKDQVSRTPEEDKARKLEKRKNKLRWLKMEQRLVELDIAVKSSLHLEKPSPERCISALEELNELSIVPFMLKKQPDIVTTVRRLRKYIGPHSFNSWQDQDAKKKMEKAIETIQKKADQIYNKFKSYFAYQGEKPFATMFEEEVEQFRQITKEMDEGKVLSMIQDPTEECSNSDED